MNVKYLFMFTGLALLLSGCCNMRATDSCATPCGSSCYTQSVTTCQTCTTSVSSCEDDGSDSCWAPDYSDHYGNTFYNVGGKDFQPMGSCCG